VLVVGGGPAGIGAALGAARTGVKTLLIETCGFFGGVAAWSLGMPINQMRPERKPRSEIHELVIEKLLAYGNQAIYIGQHQLYCNGGRRQSGYRCGREYETGPGHYIGESGS
ncbi:MAG: FAD-dependent oxidoreductase, partial [Planctomycetota bacterium]|jgi:flavin-dependent dehydrogenase